MIFCAYCTEPILRSEPPAIACDRRMHSECAMFVHPPPGYPTVAISPPSPEMRRELAIACYIAYLVRASMLKSIREDSDAVERDTRQASPGVQ